jgi:hypothetical protein
MPITALASAVGTLGASGRELLRPQSYILYLLDRRLRPPTPTSWVSHLARLGLPGAATAARATTPLLTSPTR